MALTPAQTEALRRVVSALDDALREFDPQSAFTFPLRKFRTGLGLVLGDGCLRAVAPAEVERVAP